MTRKQAIVVLFRFSLAVASNRQIPFIITLPIAGFLWLWACALLMEKR